MKTAKYRVWDKEIKQMFDVTTIDFANEFVTYWTYEKRYSTQGYNMPAVLMQFTGQVDLEGTKIFQGDQLYATGNLSEDLQYVGDVEWDEDDSRWEVVTTHGRFEYITSGCVVRGNIFEAPLFAQNNEEAMKNATLSQENLEKGKKIWRYT